MNEAAVREMLRELNDSLLASPVLRASLEKVDGMYISEGPSRDAGIEESIDRLRLQLKYILFDLEATRRENRYLRQMLETRNRPDAAGGTDKEGF